MFEWTHDMHTNWILVCHRRVAGEHILEVSLLVWHA